MIGSLRGKLVHKGLDRLVVDVGGVGYEVRVPLSTFAALQAGAEVHFHIHTQVSTESITLYGFETEREKALFQILIGIPGFGASKAMNILSGIRAADLVRAVEEKNAARLTLLPGVGNKTAELLIVQLKDRLRRLPAAAGWAEEGVPSQPPGPTSDAISALENLGYKRLQVERIVEKAARELGESPTVEDLIRTSLRLLAS